MRQNATRTDILALLAEGHSNRRIARELRCDKNRVARIRAEYDLPAHVPTRQARTLEQKWAALTRPLDGGHLEWLGQRGASSNTPVMKYKDRTYSAAGIAFRQRTGREPVGQVYAECGVTHCIAPAHVDDQPGRLRTREQLRYIKGFRARKPVCVHGHDQAVWGRYEPDGDAYCDACKAASKRPGRTEARR